MEERLNGWSKVIFDGKEGFIKSEYLQPEETEMQLSTEVTEGASVESMDTLDKNYPKKGKVTEAVNIRKTSSIEADVVGHLNKGESIEILDELNNGWTKIKHSSGDAYVKSEFVKVEETQSSATETDKDNKVNETKQEQKPGETKKGKVTESVRIRKTPSTDGTVLGLLYKGTAIEVIEQMEGGWTKIKHSSGEAYVTTEYVQLQ